MMTINVWFKFIIIICYVVVIKPIIAQPLYNVFELKIRNDNILTMGDDIGETHASIFSYYNMKWNKKWNYMIRWESTEYAGLNYKTIEPKDIFFNEVNNFQLKIDNNKLKDKSTFYALSTGLIYIQGNYLGLGASGQKNAYHTYILTKLHPNRYWNYLTLNDKEYYFPYLELNYGIKKSFFESPKFSLQTISTAELQLATNENFSDVGINYKANLCFYKSVFNIPEVALQFEGFYQSNLFNYQIAYLQLGGKLGWKRVALTSQLVKPLAKNLANPFVKYNDMELMITYGIYYYL